MIYHALKNKNKLDEYKSYMLGETDRESLVKNHDLQNEVDSVICEEITKNNYKKLFESIYERLDGKELDIIIGGPPCQAFSMVGRSRDSKRMKWDRRNTLYKYYVEFLKEFRPKIFVFENVQGLLSAAKSRHFNNMKRLMKKAGYSVDHKVLNTAEYGVPQSRKRVIVIGWNDESKLKKYPDFPKVEREYKVGDFLASLPKLKAGEMIEPTEYKETAEVICGLGMINNEVNVLESHMARPHTDQDKKIYKTAVLTKQKGMNLKYNELPSELKTHKNEINFTDRFKVVDFESPACHTVVAHISKDGHYYIHPDLEQNRSLTVREAARIQTFPDDFKFEGSRTAQFKQIGNAVPPMFSKIIANTLLKYI
jgi:DNA (cytosine-5)-methyltransferase 1